MKALGALLVLSFSASLLLSACCSSIVCQATRAAQPDLACTDEELRVENVTARIERDPLDARRYLRVEGCERHELVACVPTNLPPPPEKKVRGQQPDRPSGLEVKWSCEPISETAVRFVQGASLGSAAQP